ncbi:gfo/Idh/MocA family oxidoreductase [Putridiphycobacter roseus]|uniref:Gfo/Idh/MocA family oxidoreductase n=1 Tax=Putridiphycobacter roseus TaxID=2219161 RepID=A0A2W1MXZ8_9FLAO|nr:Gfo/Idh/MocA family oxidoreductase [Putridiphycobacter roseus]PZE16707.1 gfo/Idh/MocA family oxidoreductase [Putridiphycobacter roseus]
MLKIGLFGVGHLGKIHARLINELATTYKFVGFFDPNEENAAFVAKEYNLKRFDTVNALIDAVDCIDIVTPTLSHFEIAKTAIEKGVHVFVEKPITNNVEDAALLTELTDKHQVTVQVGHVERFNPAFTNASTFFNSPRFIETHRLAQYNPRGTDVPVVLDLMIHDIDIVLSVVKSPVRRISASGVAVVSETPDITNARIEFENGCVANLTASRISMKNMRKSRFFQKDAYISVDFLNKKTEIVKLTTLKEEADPFDIVLDMADGTTKKKIEIFSPKVDEINAIKEELSAFANAIENKTIPVVTISDGFQALKVAHLIMQDVDVNLNRIQENN